MTLPKKASLKSINKLFFYLTPIVFGIGIIVVILLTVVYTEKKALDEEIEKFEDDTEVQLQYYVENAIEMMNIYYYDNEDMDEEEMIEGITEILDALTSDDIGYYFVVDYNGNVICGPDAGTNKFDLEDKSGKKIVQELISTAQTGGGFVEYYLPVEDESEEKLKMSYILPFDECDWYVGTGIFLSEIDEMNEKFYDSVVEQIVLVAVVTSITVLSLMLIFGRINQKIFKNIDSEINDIKDYLNDSAESFKTIDDSKFLYSELGEIACQTNKLVANQYEYKELLNKQYEEIKNSAYKLESIINMLPDAIFIIDTDGFVTDYATSDKYWLLDNTGNYLGKNISDILPNNIAKECIRKIVQAIEQNKIQIYEYDLEVMGDVESFEIRFLRYKNNEAFCILRNKTDFVQAQRNYEYLSYHDQLTGVYNRRYFEEALILMDAEKNFPLTIGMVDLNGLKLTNDAFGHQVGDHMLKIVARILNDSCSENDFVARIGGDEFILVCPKTDKEKMAEKIREIFKAIDEERENYSILSISIGCDTKTKLSQSNDEVFKRAEEHMYSKKIVESQSMRNQTVQAIIKTLNEKNTREKIHSERVSKISRMIGIAMELDNITVKEIETAGLLHDIGKIAINESILDKKGMLTDEEYIEIKRHPESSYQILKSINDYAGLAEDVLSHHERWDGEGYPRGLSKKDISLFARIIAVADAYEAMTADRTYRNAISKEEAMEELRKNSGTQFDPEIVKIFEEKVFDNI